MASVSKGSGDATAPAARSSIRTVPRAKVLAPDRHHVDAAPVPSLPDIRDLSARLRFSPGEGRIWLDDQRMMLLHVNALSALRQELIESLGVDVARGLLTRLGYVSGSRDARLARRIRPDRELFEAFSVGPQLHALEGVVLVEPVRLEASVEEGRYYGEFLWFDSVEDDAALSAYGPATDPQCWMQLGYASGYTSLFMGRPILYREVQCRSMGDAHCRIVGKPLDEWGDADEDLRFYSAEDFINCRVPEPGRSLPPPAVDTRPPGAATRTRVALRPAAESSASEDDDERMVGMSSGFVAAAHKLRQVARADRTTVLFLGETGVGKEKFARMLHRISGRAGGPFVAVNCSAMPENLLEAELFGVEKGAYTGATESRRGRFERAEGGTLFLDEIGTLSAAAQSKLLRALQEREIERVGGCGPKKVDVRVVAATNVDLVEEVREGRFRADLYYRLSVFPIRIPPLRERRDDIPPLVDHFLGRYAALHGKEVTGFTDRALQALLDYGFPGNIRELENMIERGVLLASDGGPLDVAHLFTAGETIKGDHFLLGPAGRLRDVAAHDEAPAGPLDDLVRSALEDGLPLDALEARILEAAVEAEGGNLTAAARRVGLTRAQLAYRLKRRS